jgi:hypothetical protein
MLTSQPALAARSQVLYRSLEILRLLVRHRKGYRVTGPELGDDLQAIAKVCCTRNELYNITRICLILSLA